MHDNGQLAATGLSSPVAVDGISCGTEGRIFFHDSGEFAGCTLAGKYQFNGVIWPEGTNLLFRPGGSLRLARVFGPIEIEGTEYKPHELFFDEFGLLVSSSVLTGGGS